MVLALRSSHCVCILSFVRLSLSFRRMLLLSCHHASARRSLGSAPHVLCRTTSVHLPQNCNTNQQTQHRTIFTRTLQASHQPKMDKPRHGINEPTGLFSATDTAQADPVLPESAQNNPFHPLYDAHTPKESRITKGQARAAFSQDPKGEPLSHYGDIS